VLPSGGAVAHASKEKKAVKTIRKSKLRNLKERCMADLTGRF